MIATKKGVRKLNPTKAVMKQGSQQARRAVVTRVYSSGKPVNPKGKKK
jgi:hypothetical protein